MCILCFSEETFLMRFGRERGAAYRYLCFRFNRGFVLYVCRIRDLLTT